MDDHTSQRGPEIVWGRGLHTSEGTSVDADAYFHYIGRWSALFVPTLLSCADVGPGDHVLDVATGTGEVMEPALSAIGAAGSLVGVDISTAMLRSARDRVPSGACTWVAADAQRLPFGDGCFDAVVCQLGLMFLPDPSAGLTEFCRVLRPRGRASVCVIGPPERAPLWGYLADALSAVLPHERETLHLSFALADPGLLAELFTSAGFGDVHVRRDRRRVDLGPFEQYWAVVEAATGSLPYAYRSLAGADRDRVRQEVRQRMARWEVDGSVQVSIEMLLADGRA